MKRILVDVDGTLLDASLDNAFKAAVKEIGIEKAMMAYDNAIVNNLHINMSLVNELRAMKEEGYEICLWTNRGSKQIEMTMQNLACCIDLFDACYFRGGKKGSDDVSDCIVIDNEMQYVAKGAVGSILVD